MAQKLSIAVMMQDEDVMLPMLFNGIEKSVGGDIISEIVFIDGGSSDQSLQQIHDWKIPCKKIIIHHEFDSYGKQRNRALALCTGDWILSLDADMTFGINFRDTFLHGQFETHVMWDFILYFILTDKFHHGRGQGPTTRLFKNHLGIRYVWDVHEHPMLPAHDLGTVYTTEAGKHAGFAAMHAGRISLNSEIPFFENSLLLDDNKLLDRGVRRAGLAEKSAKRGLPVGGKDDYIKRKSGIITNRQFVPFNNSIRNLIP